MPRSSLVVLYNWQAPKQLELSISQVAQNMVCDRQKIPACNTCESCLALLKEPKNYIYELKDVTVDSMQSLVRSLDYAVNTLAPVILLRQEQVNNAALSILLKTLEEPKCGFTVIIVCQNKYELLPTILSRATQINILETFSTKEASDRERDPVVEQILSYLLAYDHKPVTQLKQWMKHSEQDELIRSLQKAISLSIIEHKKNNYLLYTKLNEYVKNSTLHENILFYLAMLFRRYLSYS